MFNYQELKRVATKYYPRERGYCAVIAVSVAAQVPFGKSRSLLHKYGRDQGRGAQGAGRSCCTLAAMLVASVMVCWKIGQQTMAVESVCSVSIE